MKTPVSGWHLQLAVAGTVIVATLWLRPAVFEHQMRVEPPPLVARDSDTLTVHYHERVPYYTMADGQMSGSCGEPVRLALERAGIPHRWQETPPQRQVMTLRAGNGRDAAIGWFKRADRESFARFSSPIYQDRPYVLLARVDDERFASGRQVAEFLGRRELRLLVKESYSYGATLDAAIALGRPLMEVTTGDNLSMLRVIAAGRADYFFLGEEEAYALLERSEPGAHACKIVTLADLPAGAARHLMFSRAVPPDWVERIDRELVALAPGGSDHGSEGGR